MFYNYINNLSSDIYLPALFNFINQLMYEIVVLSVLYCQLVVYYFRGL